MPLISVITAALHPRTDFLLQAWESILASTPASWNFEWCIQEDGDTPRLATALPDDPRIQYAANGIQAGTAATRNAAISRAHGEWIVNLDSDDYYTAGGLSLLISLIENHPDAIWIGGRAHDYLDEHQQFVEFPDYLPQGRVDSQTFMECWTKSGLVFPFHVAGAGIRTDVIRALGGYVALPFGQDIALFGAATQLGAGAYSTQPIFNYRRWTGQSTQQPARQRWNIGTYEHQRIAAIQKLGLRFTP